MQPRNLESNDLTEDSPLLPLLHDLKKTGIYLNQDKKHSEEEVNGKGKNFTEEAILAVNAAFQQATLLPKSQKFSEAAHILENIQVSLIQAERAAYQSHDPIARRAYDLAKKITSASRRLFHELKEKLT